MQVGLSQPPVETQTERPTSTITWNTGDGILVVFAAFLIYIFGSIVLVSIDRAFEHKVGFWVAPVSYLFLTGGTFSVAYGAIIRRRGGSWTAIGFRRPAIWRPGDDPVSMGGAVVTAFFALIAMAGVHGLSPKHGAAVGNWIGVGVIGLVAAIIIGCQLLGLNRRNPWTKVIAAPPLAYGAFLVGAAIISAVLEALTNFHVKGNSRELLPPHQSHLTFAQFIVLLILAAILAPITEETLFRGVLFQGLRSDTSGRLGLKWGIVAAAVASGTLFGLAHLLGGAGEINTLPILIFLGIVLAFAFQYADTLAASMLVHGSLNGLAIVALFVR